MLFKTKKQRPLHKANGIEKQVDRKSVYSE